MGEFQGWPQDKEKLVHIGQLVPPPPGQYQPTVDLLNTSFQQQHPVKQLHFNSNNCQLSSGCPSYPCTGQGATDIGLKNRCKWILCRAEDMVCFCVLTYHCTKPYLNWQSTQFPSQSTNCTLFIF